MPATYALRPATASDLELTYAITEDAMRGYVEQTWGAWDEAAQRVKHRSQFTPATYRVVECDGTAAGLLAVEEEPADLWLFKLYLFRGFRGRGLGGALLQRVIDEGAALGKPVRLKVLRVNQAALRLYLRKGFRVTGEEPERLFMIHDAVRHSTAFGKNSC